MSTSGTQTMDQVQDRPADGAVLGASSLSYCHICTPGADDRHIETSWRDDRAAGSQDVTFYAGGSLIEVQDVRQDAAGAKRASGLRGVLRETSRRRQVGDRDEGAAAARRGKVRGFSAKSRRRLHLLLGKVDAGAGVLFVTLTVSDAVAHDGRSMKEYLRRFKARVARRFPAASMLWRLECVPRKSGAFVGVAVGHYHALLWGVPDQPGLRDWIADAWSGAVGDVSRTRVEVPRSSKRVQGYMSKLYLAKEGDDQVIADVGRSWGVLQDDRIPWAAAVVRRLTYREAVQLLRVLRRWIVAGRRSRGRRGKVPYLTRWRAFFVPDPVFWAGRLGGIVADPVDPLSVKAARLKGRAVAVRSL